MCIASALSLQSPAVLYDAPSSLQPWCTYNSMSLLPCTPWLPYLYTISFLYTVSVSGYASQRSGMGCISLNFLHVFALTWCMVHGAWCMVHGASSPHHLGCTLYTSFAASLHVKVHIRQSPVASPSLGLMR